MLGKHVPKLLTYSPHQAHITVPSIASFEMLGLRVFLPLVKITALGKGCDPGRSLRRSLTFAWAPLLVCWAFFSTWERSGGSEREGTENKGWTNILAGQT